MNMRLSKSKKEEVEKLHGQTIGFLDGPCDKCKEYMQLGVILISYDPRMTNDIKDPYRTGGFFVVKDELIQKIFRPAEVVEDVLEKRVAFVEHEAATQLGFFEVATNNN